MNHPLSVKAGPTAYRLIREHGFSLANVRVIVAASGGAKWLVLNQMDRVLFPMLKAAATAPVHLLCSSIGSWRMSILAMANPLAAIDRFESTYVDYEWLKKPGPSDVSRVTRWTLDQLLGDRGEQEILSDPYMRMHILAVRSKHLLAYDSKLPLLMGLLSTWGANAVSRRNLRFFFERALFSDPRSRAPFHDMVDDTGLATINVDLNDGNYRDAVMATSSIPLVMDGIPEIAGAPKGMYRDGGFTDYHFNSAFLGDVTEPSNDLVLYPHYRERIIPGWFDKAWQGRGPSAQYYDRALVIAPSDEFAASLPYGKIPDRGDFKTFDHKTRVAYWRRVLEETARLGDDLRHLLIDDGLAARVRPL